MSQPINRIEKEFIFKTLISDSTPLVLQWYKREITCYIKKVSDKFLELFLKEGEFPAIKPREEVRVYFQFLHHKHTFKSKIYDKTAVSLILDQPDFIYKNLKRQFERIKTGDDIRIELQLQNKPALIPFPRIANPIKKKIATDTVKSTSKSKDIPGLIHNFKKTIENKTSKNQITMMRTKTPQSYEEKLMAYSGKAIWLPTVKGGLKNHLVNENILSSDDIFEMERENGLMPDEITNNFKELLIEKNEREIYAELYCPIIYKDIFAGYIYLYNTFEKKEEIGWDIVQFVLDFSQVLCNGLMENNYFTSVLDINAYTQIPIIDISASGLLFANREPVMAKALSIFAPVNIIINIQNRKLPIPSKIARKIENSDSFLYGVKFDIIKPEDFRFLYEYIYGKPYNDFNAVIEEFNNS